MREASSGDVVAIWVADTDLTSWRCPTSTITTTTTTLNTVYCHLRPHAAETARYSQKTRLLLFIGVYCRNVEFIKEARQLRPTSLWLLEIITLPVYPNVWSAMDTCRRLRSFNAASNRAPASPIPSHQPITPTAAFLNTYLAFSTFTAPAAAR